MTKLMSPQPGKVNTQVSTMSFTTPKVDGGEPLHRPHAHDGAGLGVGGGHWDAEQAGEQQAEPPPPGPRRTPGTSPGCTISIPTDLMIFSPPTLVPRPITVLHSSISQAGMTIPVTLLLPAAEGHAQKEHADELLARPGPRA